MKIARFGGGRLSRRSERAGLLLGALLWSAAPLGLAATAGEALVKRGEYIYRAGGCANCHTTRNGGAENAGGVAVESPFGVFYGPNITPDREHGIGAWSEADFVRALRAGVSPAGEHYYPAFPYTSYTRLHDDDLRALWAYLNSRPAVARPNKPHELVWYARFRPALGLWKMRYFMPGPFTPDSARPAQVNRGAYLAAAVHCVECHTPRDLLGGLKPDLYYAGTRDGPDGAAIPNITPDKKTGIGEWSRSDLAYYLEMGLAPDGDSAGDLMADVIDNSTGHLTREDLDAIAAYVFSLPPIEHDVSDSQK